MTLVGEQGRTSQEALQAKVLLHVLQGFLVEVCCSMDCPELQTLQHHLHLGPGVQHMAADKYADSLHTLHLCCSIIKPDEDSD